MPGRDRQGSTSDIYVHCTAEDLRGELERAGVMGQLGRVL